VPPVLYLDTARLGKMSPGAQHALSEFHSLAGDIGCCMYFEVFLQQGFPAPRSEWPFLSSWRGIDGLKTRLKRFAGAVPDSRVLLANRSSQLMKLAAHLLAGRCRNVLITDLTWPSYARILRVVAEITDCRVSCLPLRRQIFADRMMAAEITTFVREAYQSLNCDGLFLPLVDNLGIHFPVKECVHAIRENAHVQFVAVDGAQALGHVPVRLADLPCDIFLAGCHKWLRAYQPLGLAFFGRPESQAFIQETVATLQGEGVLDDPLLVFTENYGTGRRTAFGETVNLSPLLTCHGALLDAEAEQRSNGAFRQLNTELLCEAADGTAWRPVPVHQSIQSNITVMHRANGPPSSSERLRQRFHSAQVALTAYANATIRLSLPFERLASQEQDQLAVAFRVV